MNNRVVITGLGIVSPNGINLTQFKEAIKNGVSGIRHDEQLEALKELTRQQKLEENRASASAISIPVPSPNVIDVAIEEAVVIEPQQIEEAEDETTLKLRKLKTLYDKQLITREEYESKKSATGTGL